MIPYFQWIHFYIGPVPIQVWGLLVSAGIVAGLFLAIRYGKSQEIPSQDIIDLSFWIILAALVGGRLVYVVSNFYHFVQLPLDVVKIWQGGMSISGGFLGALIAGWIVIRIKKYPTLKYIETCLFGLPLGLFIGRLGCFCIFDHPGSPTSFFLGQQYVDGIVRHNHGLYLSLNGLLLTILFLCLWRFKKNIKTGFFIIIFLIWYGVVRFFFDFFRSWDLHVVDARYFGLTIAQYMAIIMVAGGLYLWYSLYRKVNKK